MAAPRKYPEELRERAIRMAIDLRRDPATRIGALRRVGEQLGINPETLRNWVSQVDIDEGHRPGVTTVEAQRIAERERENRELVGRTRSCGRHQHREELGVEPICRVLRKAGMQIAPAATTPHGSGHPRPGRWPTSSTCGCCGGCTRKLSPGTWCTTGPGLSVAS